MRHLHRIIIILGVIFALSSFSVFAADEWVKDYEKSAFSPEIIRYYPLKTTTYKSLSDENIPYLDDIDETEEFKRRRNKNKIKEDTLDGKRLPPRNPNDTDTDGEDPYNAELMNLGLLRFEPDNTRSEAIATSIDTRYRFIKDPASGQTIPLGGGGGLTGLLNANASGLINPIGFYSGNSLNATGGNVYGSILFGSSEEPPGLPFGSGQSFGEASQSSTGNNQAGSSTTRSSMTTSGTTHSPARTISTSTTTTPRITAPSTAATRIIPPTTDKELSREVNDGKIK